MINNSHSKPPVTAEEKQILRRYLSIRENCTLNDDGTWNHCYDCINVYRKIAEFMAENANMGVQITYMQLLGMTRKTNLRRLYNRGERLLDVMISRWVPDTLEKVNIVPQQNLGDLAVNENEDANDNEPNVNDGDSDEEDREIPESELPVQEEPIQENVLEITDENIGEILKGRHIRGTQRDELLDQLVHTVLSWNSITDENAATTYHLLPLKVPEGRPPLRP
uniref:Uncharacterized protein n=1 Tax=Panagrolaimus sp. PS1159 TaxID=55785 RepID=A0AC35GY12_9BILA